MRLLFIPLLVLVSGCVPYPVYKTLQPESEVVVRSEAGEPVQGASVHLIANSYPYGWERSRTVKTTDGSGAVRFSKEAEWRIEAIALHGAQIFVWNWCVCKPGFETQVTAYQSGREFVRNLEVTLRKGEETPCPEPFRL